MYGDDIAAVIAEDDIAARRAADKIKVEYEEYPVILDPEASMKEGAPLLHEEKPGNVIAHTSFVLGDESFEEAVKEEGLTIIEKEYRTQPVQHCHIEVPVSYAYMEKGRIVIVTLHPNPPYCETGGQSGSWDPCRSDPGDKALYRRRFW